MRAPVPPDEIQRLAALSRYGILDTPREEPFDDVARLAAQICESPISLVSLVDRNRQWFKAHVGLPLALSETPRDSAFCAHAILQPAELLLVPDALEDRRFADNPLVTGEPFIRFYAGAPLVTPEGHALGTLCVIDRVPRVLRPDQQSALRALGRLVVELLESRRLSLDRTPERTETFAGTAAIREDERVRPFPSRFLFYSHDGLGLGHTRRNLAIAEAITRLSPDASVLLATGVDEIHEYELPPRVEVLKLPGIRKVANEVYSARRLSIPTPDVRALRSAVLLGAARSFRPTVTLVDKHPFGAGGEFHAGLEAVRGSGGCAVLGLRDILDEPATVIRDWETNQFYRRILDYYEAVLIYGEPAVFDAVREYDLPPAVAGRAHFCGYVTNEAGPREGTRTPDHPLAPRRDRRRPLVLATTGAGEDGFRLLETFLRASAGARWQAVAVAGSRLSEGDLATLKRLADGAGARLHRFLPGLARTLGSVDAVVCMGGYNTLAEAMSRGVPTVCVPRTSPRREQLLRAAAFERLGLLQVLLPERLEVEALRHALGEALSTPRGPLRERIAASLRFDGAVRAARLLLALAGRAAPAPKRAEARRAAPGT